MPSRALLLPFAVVAAAALAACAVDIRWNGESPGAAATEDRPVSAGVTAVDLSTTGTLTLAAGDPALTVTAGRNVLHDVTTEVRGGTLVIGMSPSWRDPGPVSYRLTLPALSSVRLSGSGEVTGELAGAGPSRLDLSGSGRIDLGTLDADELTVAVGGSGEVVVDHVTAGSATVRIDGSGRAELTGSAGDLGVTVAGSGEVSARDLVAQDVVVRVPGSGSVDVDAERTLDAAVSGSGQVRYAGDPRVTRSVTGSGHVGRA